MDVYRLENVDFWSFFAKNTFMATENKSDCMDGVHASYHNAINRWMLKRPGFGGQIVNLDHVDLDYCTFWVPNRVVSRQRRPISYVNAILTRRIPM